MRAAIRSEADLQAVVVAHLKDQLRRYDDHWIIGANFRLGEYCPDVLCYYAPLGYSEFVREYLNENKTLVAAIEIKWASKLKDDLAKLSEIQRQHRNEILAWMVYGGHFSPSIHRAYANEDRQREISIREWVADHAKVWGTTIIRCGKIEAAGINARFTERVRAMKNHWWINDRDARKAMTCELGGRAELDNADK